MTNVNLIQPKLLNFNQVLESIPDKRQEKNTTSLKFKKDLYHFKKDIEQYKESIESLLDVNNEEGENYISDINKNENLKNHIEKAKKLKIVSRHGVGYDNVDYQELKKRNIPLTIVGDVNLILKEEYLLHSMGLIDEKYWKKYK